MDGGIFLQSDVKKQEKDTSAEAGVVDWGGADVQSTHGGFEAQGDKASGESDDCHVTLETI